jgi:hypothetical protein
MSKIMLAADWQATYSAIPTAVYRFYANRQNTTKLARSMMPSLMTQIDWTKILELYITFFRRFMTSMWVARKILNLKQLHKLERDGIRHPATS